MDNREIDTLIAEKVFNWELMTDTSMVKAGFLTYKRMSRALVMDWQETLIPEFSTDISAAWQVVEKLKELGYSFDAGSWEHVGDGNDWCVEFEHQSELIEHRGLAPAFPMAICLAALKAVGVDYNHYTEQLKEE